MLTAGTKLGSYEILSQIGAGGMGEVYRTRDAKLGRDVAIKVLPEEFARDAERMAGFQREAKVLTSVNHPNIVSIRAAGKGGFMGRNSALLAMVFLAGLSAGLLMRSTAVAAPRETETRAADLAATEKLHRADEECTLTQDPKCLIALWSEDGINLGFPGPPVLGTKAMGEAYAKFRAQYPDFKVLKYAPDYKTTQTAILDDWAIEVGYSEGIYKTSENAAPVTTPRTKGMRLLKRQADG